MLNYIFFFIRKKKKIHYVKLHLTRSWNEIAADHDLAFWFLLIGGGLLQNLTL